MSVPERLATIQAKGATRQALRTYIVDAVTACENAAGLTGLNTPEVAEWFDTESRDSLIDYMDTKNHVACQSVFQPSNSRTIGKLTGSPTESSELREILLEVVTSHVFQSWDSVTFYGKELTEIEDVMAARSDVYNGAVKRVLRQYAKGLAGGAIQTLEILSDNTTIQPPQDRRGLVAFATVRIRITQEVIVQHCTSS